MFVVVVVVVVVAAAAVVVALLLTVAPDLARVGSGAQLKGGAFRVLAAEVRDRVHAARATAARGR